MSSVLISHVAADVEAAAQLADALETSGFEVSAGRPGDLGADAALARSDAIVLLATPDSLASDELTAQVLRGYERGTPFVPVLLGVTHLDLTTKQPAWRSAIGSATAIEVPPEGVAAVAARVVEGVRSVTAPVPRGAREPTRGRRAGIIAGAAAIVLALILGVAWWASTRDGDDSTTGSTNQPTGSASASPSPTAPTSAAVVDSATTPVKSEVGDLRIVRVRLVKEFCVGPEGNDCARAKGDNRIVVLKVREWNGGNLPYTEEFARQMDRAYVQAGEQTAGFTKGNQSFDQSTWEIAYIPLPASAVEGEVLLRWPGNPTMLLHPVAE